MKKNDMKKEIRKQITRKNKQHANYGWIIKITVLAFTISFAFSFLSESLIPNVNVIVATIILLLFIGLGILFDMIGVAVTSSDEEPFHSMSSRKIKGAKQAVLLKKNADKVSSFCNDVIGDVCGIISGTVGITIALNLSKFIPLPLFIITLIMTAIIAALTIGGKAVFKSIAINRSNEILYGFAKVLAFFKRS